MNQRDKITEKYLLGLKSKIDSMPTNEVGNLLQYRLEVLALMIQSGRDEEAALSYNACQVIARSLQERE